MILERNAYGEGKHRFHAGFLDFARHSGFVIKVCKTKGKVERFNGYLRRTFYVPLDSRLKQRGQQLDFVAANAEVAHWLRDVAHERVHGTTGERPVVRLQAEARHLQFLPPPWRADVAAARPLPPSSTVAETPARPACVAECLEENLLAQHSLAAYERVIATIRDGALA